MATQDETLFKLRSWESEIKAKNALKNLEERLKDGVQVEDVRATLEDAVGVVEEATSIAAKVEDRLEDGLQIRDVTETLKDIKAPGEVIQIAEKVETLVKKTEERLKDGLQVQDVIDTLKDVEEVTMTGCWCWSKKPVTSTPGPTAKPQ